MTSNLNQTLQNKYPNLDIHISNFQSIDKEYLIFGSDFNGKSRELSLNSINSNKKVIDFFDLISKTFKYTNEKSFVYDLTHSLGNFLQDTELSNDLGSGKKLAIENDFVISRLRSYLQEIAVVQPKKHKQFFSTEYLIYRPKTDKISANTLLAFSLSKPVQNILNKSQYGTEHPRFYEFVFNEMPIPNSIFALNNEIDEIMKNAYECLEQSKDLYRQAEILLYEEIGLDPNDPLLSIQPLSNRLNVSVQTLKQSFLATGRLDSEYYQQKYDDIENLIKNYRGGYFSFDDTEIKDRKFIPKDDEFYKYIELANISSNGNINESELQNGKNLPSRARRLVKNGDLIVSSVEGSFSSCAIITKEFDGYIVSTGFYVIKSARINSETLLVLFKSKFFQDYLKKFSNGTILTAISKDEFKNLLIPKFSLKIQESIAKNLQKSFDLISEAKNLLKNAKEMVENSIIVGGGVTPRYLFAEVKILLKKARYFYRLATWQIYEELFFAPSYDKFSHLNINTRSLSQSLNATGRLDSEYYQQKYDLMEKQIKKNGFKTLEEICSLINYGSVPTSPYSETDTGVPYIKGLNLKNLQIDETKLDRITNTEDLNSRFFTKENDIVISQMGTVGDVGVVSKEQENYIFASFTIRVRLKNIDEFNPYFVALYIQNIAKEWYLYRNIAQASVRQNTDLPTIKNLYVPLISYEKQTQIAEKIKQSFTLRNKASELLQQAKSKVETAIEQSLAI
ncbi:restriction endonuclease subunit S [Campylobacter sp. 1BO]|uniref:restriction endonuclease subunit S n=1 Tax=Campylobacter sp. 1BO TaxID=3424760 RepID=UPI003D339401